MGTTVGAHVLVDAATAFDRELRDAAVNRAAMNLAMERLNAVDAVTATFDDETAGHALDASPLLGAAVLGMSWLVGPAAELGNTSREEVSAELREFLDGDLP